MALSMKSRWFCRSSKTALKLVMAAARLASWFTELRISEALVLLLCVIVRSSCCSALMGFVGEEIGDVEGEVEGGESCSSLMCTLVGGIGIGFE